MANCNAAVLRLPTSYRLSSSLGSCWALSNSPQIFFQFYLLLYLFPVSWGCTSQSLRCDRSLLLEVVQKKYRHYHHHLITLCKYFTISIILVILIIFYVEFSNLFAKKYLREKGKRNIYKFCVFIYIFF